MSHPYGDIPELSNLQTGHGIIRIPMEQDVPFTARVRALVDTAEFQRLAQISQLGLASRVYPGATHARFEHALGVFHNSLRYLWQLGRDPRFVEIVDRHTAEILMVAALLHDLGHWPFCHPIEDMSLPDLPPHEAHAQAFLAPDRQLTRVLREQWNIEPEEVLDVLVAKTNSSAMRLIRSILSGPIDIDKMDYLERDSLHAGVPYGRNFDKSRLIQSLIVNAEGDGLAITTKGRTAAELMVFARYVMFSEVYWHHAVRSATCMFARGFYELKDQLDLQRFFESGEAESIRELRSLANGTRCEQLLEGIFGPTRLLFKRVLEYGSRPQSEVYQRLSGQPYSVLVSCGQRLCELLNKDLGIQLIETDLLIDAPPPHREVQFHVDIYDPKDGQYRPLASVSPVVEALAKHQFDDIVKRVRIFAHPRVKQQLADSPSLEPNLEQAINETCSEGGTRVEGRGSRD